MSTKVKQVRFDVYKATLSLEKGSVNAIQKLDEDIEKINEKANPNGYFRKRLKELSERREKLAFKHKSAYVGSWDVKSLITYAIAQKEPITMNYGGEVVEIDTSTVYNSDPHILAFQLTNLRSNELPAKKKIGKDRVDVSLSEDEYIGEFTQIIIDDRYNLVVIQSFRHGTGVTAVEKFLNTIMWEKKKQEFGDDEIVNIGTLEPVIDPKEIEKLEKQKFFKKLQIRCSDLNDQKLNDKGITHFAGVEEYLDKVKGYTIDFSISFTERDRSQTLSADKVRRDIASFLAFQGDKFVSKKAKESAGMEVTYLDESLNKYVAIDLLTPKVSFFVPVTFVDRQNVRSHDLYDTVKAEYDKLNSKLFRLFGRIGDEYEEKLEKPIAGLEVGY